MYSFGEKLYIEYADLIVLCLYLSVKLFLQAPVRHFNYKIHLTRLETSS